VISISNLTRRFGDRIAVEELSLEIRSGEIVALLGPNGAGKTTTLRMLAGLIAPSSGSAVVDGVRLSRQSGPAVRARVGFLTEAPGHWDRLTVRSNLTTYAQLYSVPDARAAVDRALALFGLADRASSLAGELSKGLKQRLALARTVIHGPRVLLLDEPTSGLDPLTTKSVRELIVSLGREGRTILISTHNLDEAERVANRVVVLQQRLIAVDTPTALRQRLFGRRLQLSLTSAADQFVPVVASLGVENTRATGNELSIEVSGSGVETPAIVRALVEAGAGIESVQVESAPLEDVYLRLIQ
jgi:ABC-2 type transport system ATP-binding protein